MATAAKSTKVAIVGAGPVGLLASRLLASYQIPHVLIERRTKERTHPQAHYLNARTMEVLRSHSWETFVTSSKLSPPSTTWRDFVYCHSLVGTEYVRIDHMENSSNARKSNDGLNSPTTVLHLPQHTFESILTKDHARYLQYIGQNISSTSEIQHLMGYEAKLCDVGKNGCTLTLQRQPENSNTYPLPDKFQLHCDYLIAADGAHSQVRQQLAIPLEGQYAIQHLMNIHFRCPGLKNHLKIRPGMLYFVFHPQVVAVFVSHDPLHDEWVCQIPYFPPFQTPSDFTETEIQRLLAAAIFNTSSASSPCRTEILHTNSWAMHAQVAKHLSAPSMPVPEQRNPKSIDRIFLVGDAAHRFPPAGGFGMNTGLQDAHNLAWKLAYAIQSDSSPSAENGIKRWLGASYHRERHYIASENTAFSLRNFEKTSKCAAALGLDPQLAQLAVNMSDNAVSRTMMPMFVRKQMFLKALQTGLASLQGFERWQTAGDNKQPSRSGLTNTISTSYARYRVQQLQHLVRTGQSLPLIFPEQDLGLAYPLDPQNSYKLPHAHSDSSVTGKRIVHSWISIDVPPNSINQLPPSSAPLISSVDLPALIHRHDPRHREESTARQPCPPPFLLVVPTTSATSSATRSTLQQVLNLLPESTKPHLVCVICSRAVGDDESSTELQCKYQAPHLLTTAENQAYMAKHHHAQNSLGYLKEVKQSEMAPFASYESWEPLFSDYLSSSSSSKPQLMVNDKMVIVRDHSGSLFNLLVHDNTSNASNSIGMKVMLVRPDSHVQAMFSLPETPAADTLATWIQNELHFLAT